MVINRTCLSLANKQFEVEIVGIVLRWARDRLALSIEEAAAKAKVPASTIRDLESNHLRPTYSLLEMLADVYSTNVPTLLRSQAPPLPLRPPDFRGAFGMPAEYSHAVASVVNRARALQQLATDLGVTPSSALYSAQVHTSAETAALAVRDRLGISTDTQIKWRGPYDAFRAWRSRIEEEGVVVLQLPVKGEELRGLALTDLGAPLVAVRSSDYINSRIFTLFHELGHLVNHQEALCSASDGPQRDAAEGAETWANDFAEAALVPSDAVSAMTGIDDSEDLDTVAEGVERASSRFKVSRFVMLYRLRAQERISDLTFSVLWERFAAQVGKRSSQGRAPHGLSLPLQRLGEGFVRRIVHAAYVGDLTRAEAMTYMQLPAKYWPETSSLLVR